MAEKLVKLVFDPSKSHRTHNDEWNVFTEKGQVGEYPESVAKEKLADFPLNFKVYREAIEPEKKAKPQPKPIEEEEQPKKVKDEPDKMDKGAKTKTK